jgi:hypothetical protein
VLSICCVCIPRVLAMMDMKLLEKRLLTRDSTLSVSSVSKCASRLQQYLAAVQAGREMQQTKDALIRDMCLYKIEISQVIEATLMCDRELEESKAIEKSVEEDISKAEMDINNLNKELAEQKSIRKHKEECELLARLVNTLPSKTVVGNDIKKALDALSPLRKQSESAEYRVNMRKKQFQVLQQTIFDMKRNLEEESEQQGLLAVVESTNAAEDEEAAPPMADSDAEAEDSEEGKGGRRGRGDDGPPQKKSRSSPPLGESEAGVEEEGEDSPPAAAAEEAGEDGKNSHLEDAGV